ncbi:MAG: GxxExxY protein [Candidatus Sungbacteria bacterium]|nr:GxxExxY protein [Candidatus Sungbacteria bacterium]
MREIKKKDLLYPDLSYQVVGILFEVFNELGYQYQEKYYQRAISKSLHLVGIPFQEQIIFPIEFKGQKIGRYIFDFLVDNKIVLEIKRGDTFSPQDIRQTIAYLKRSNLRLGILARFSSKGLKFKRIVNIIDS